MDSGVVAGCYVEAAGRLDHLAFAGLDGDLAPADAWACRSSRHVVSERRSGAGRIFSALRTLRTVDVPARWPA